MPCVTTIPGQGLIEGTITAPEAESGSWAALKLTPSGAPPELACFRSRAAG